MLAIQRFESHFEYPLWESEKEYLADRLKVERWGKHESYIQHELPVRRETKNIPKNLRGLSRDKKHAQINRGSGMAMEEGNDTGCRREVEIEGSSEGEEEEIERALKWLREEWDSMVEFLREKEPDSTWEADY